MIALPPIPINHHKKMAVGTTAVQPEACLTRSSLGYIRGKVRSGRVSSAGCHGGDSWAEGDADPMMAARCQIAGSPSASCTPHQQTHMLDQRVGPVVVLSYLILSCGA